MQLMRGSALTLDGVRRRRTGDISLWSIEWIRVRWAKRCRERGIKFRVIRHNTLLSLYHTALRSSAFMKPWEGAKPMAQSVCRVESSSSFGKFSLMLFPLGAALPYSAVFKATCVTLNLTKSVWSKAEVFYLLKRQWEWASRALAKSLWMSADPCLIRFSHAFCRL